MEVTLTGEFKFFVFLLENYAEYKNMKTGDVLKLWDKHNITKEIYDSYYIYHIEAITNAYMDIDSLLKIGKHAY